MENLTETSLLETSDDLLVNESEKNIAIDKQKLMPSSYI